MSSWSWLAWSNFVELFSTMTWSEFLTSFLVILAVGFAGWLGSNCLEGVDNIFVYIGANVDAMKKQDEIDKRYAREFNERHAFIRTLPGYRDL